MGKQSTIEWTDHTFNPWWGCTKISPGCKHCYAETWSNRYGHDIWGPRKSRRKMSDKYWQEPLRWNRSAAQQGRRVRVFCASMADVFEDHESIEEDRSRLWSLIDETPMIDWLLLTKRPENMMRFVPWQAAWPENVWAMTSVENQEQADIRIPILQQVPAVVRALSVEPLIGPVDLSRLATDIQWVIVGGESGHGARPLEADWVRHLRDQCQQMHIPFFFKQWGENAPTLDPTHREVMQRVGKKEAGRVLDGRTWDEMPTPLALSR